VEYDMQKYRIFSILFLGVISNINAMNIELIVIKNMIIDSLTDFTNKYPEKEIFTLFVSCEPIHGYAYIHIDTFENSQEQIEWLINNGNQDWYSIDEYGAFNDNGFSSKYKQYKKNYFENWYNAYWGNEDDEDFYGKGNLIENNQFYQKLKELEARGLTQEEKELYAIENWDKLLSLIYAKRTVIVKDYDNNEIEIQIGDDDEYNKHYFDLLSRLIDEIISDLNFGSYNIDNNFRIILEFLDSKYKKIWKL
jgi:hypothetical protein